MLRNMECRVAFGTAAKSEAAGLFDISAKSEFSPGNVAELI
jgi:hypothetical protein